MCGPRKKRFLLLYGTQKGQAKAIAEEIGQQAEQHGFVADIVSLENLENFSLEEETDPLIVVISTTGTGEPPEPAAKFVRRIQNKDLPGNYLSHLRYGLLALGDSEFTFFCNGGKMVDRRFQELGAERFYDTGYADDSTGLELVVEPWIEGLWAALQKEFMNRPDGPEKAGDNKTAVSVQNVQIVPEVLDLQMKSLSLNGDPSDTPKDSAPSLARSAPPLCQGSLNVPSLPVPYLEVLVLDCDGQEAEPSSLYPGETVLRVPIAQARRLTTEDAAKAALMLELDVAHTNMDFQPGDSFCVICPNPRGEVDDLLTKLGLGEKRKGQICVSVKTGTKKRGASVPDYIPEKCSAEFLLTWCLEIRATPKKAMIRALVEHTTDAGERRRLQELCSKQGGPDYNRYVRDLSVNILDFLQAFPSCRPPIALLIEHLPRLQARPYSAASSNLFYPGRLRFVFNVVEFAPCLERPSPRRGVCTGWLASLVGGSEEASDSSVRPSEDNATPPQIFIFSRPSSSSFRLPPDMSVPIVMVGPGTGVAPFVAFLQHREKLRQQGGDVQCGDSWLFFGCRSHEKDYLFREELSSFVESGALTHLKVSFSREAPEGAEEGRPKYVQDNLRTHAKDIVRVLTELNGRIYVCGDAKNMAKDVNEALTDIVSSELSVDKLEAMKALASLRDQKRYVQDVWA